MIKQEELLARQMQLQTEADAIFEEMHLKQLLTKAGTPVKVGSAALGLMAWRDLDITVVCSKLNIGTISGIASQLMSCPQVRDLKFINDTGNWNTDPTYPDGYFLGITYEYLGDGIRDQFNFRVGLGRMSELGYGMLFGSDVQKQFFLKQIKGRGYVDKGDNVISEFYTPLVPKGHDFLKEIEKLVS